MGEFGDARPSEAGLAEHDLPRAMFSKLFWIQGARMETKFPFADGFTIPADVVEPWLWSHVLSADIAQKERLTMT
jgi:hypothetical protein